MRAKIRGRHMLLAVALTLAALLAATVTGPSLHSMLSRADTARAHAESVRSQVTLAGQLRSDPRARARLQTLQRRIPAQPDLGVALRDLQATVEHVGVHWLSASTSDEGVVPLAGQHVHRFTVTFTATGAADQLAGALRAVEAGPRLVLVRSVQTALGASTSDTVTVELFSQDRTQGVSR